MHSGCLSASQAESEHDLNTAIHFSLSFKRLPHQVHEAIRSLLLLARKRVALRGVCCQPICIICSLSPVLGVICVTVSVYGCLAFVRTGQLWLAGHRWLLLQNSCIPRA